MKKSLILFIMLFCIDFIFAQTNPTPQPLPYSQDFSTLSHSSTTYPAGWQGWTVSTSPGSTFNTSAPIANRDLIANSTAATTSGDVHNYNGKIGFLNSGSLDLSIVLSLNTSGYTNIQVQYNIMTIRNPYDGNSNTRINEVTLQYRVGTSGSFTTLTGIEYQNTTTNQTGNTTDPQNSQSRTVTLPSACDNQPVVQIRWISRQVSGSGSRPSFAVDSVNVTGILSTPVLIVSPNSLSGFNYIVGSGPSSSQSFILSGSNLTPPDGNISISPLNYFEISLDNTNFSSQIQLTYSGNSLSNTNIYVRLKAGLYPTGYNENISISGGNANTLVSLSGFVLFEEPTNDVSNFSASAGSPSYSKIVLNWTDATGGVEPDGYLIIGSSVGFGDIIDPSDGVVYSEGLLIKYIVQGEQTTTFNELDGNKTYYFKIFSYRGSGISINYKTSGTVPQLSFTTDNYPPNLLFEHNFEYNGSIEDYGWTRHSGSGTPINTTSGLTYAGYPSSGIGGAAQVSGNSDDLHKTFGPVTTTSDIYVSFLLNVQSASSTKDYFLHLGPYSIGITFRGRIFARSNGSGWSLGLSKSNETSVDNNTVLDFNTTYLIVMKYSFNTAATNDDQVTLYVYQSGVPATEPGSPLVTIGPVGAGTDGDPTNIGSIAIRQGSSTPSYIIDGIRVATAWEQAPLPVELLSFKVVNQNKMIILTWSTSAETQNYGWEIERSQIDKSTNRPSAWQVIGFVKGSGNSNSPKEYSFIDNTAIYGEYAYRLKQIDIDGTTSYSDELRIFVGSKPQVYDLKAYPNPFNPSTTIRFELPEAGNVRLEVYDVLGRLVGVIMDEYLEEGIYQKEFDGSKLTSGIYLSVLNANGQKIVRKMQLIK